MKLVLTIMTLLFWSCDFKQTSTITRLNLSNQKLLAVPDSVFTLTNLEYLQLGNSFTLYPPLSALGGKTTNDSTLNKITELPTEIENLHHLRALGLCYNNLQTLPKQLVKLDKLDSLDLSFNENLSIASIAGILSQMSWLKYLNIEATNMDTATVTSLRKKLPSTKIDTKPEYIEIDLPGTSQ